MRVHVSWCIGWWCIGVLLGAALSIKYVLPHELLALAIFLAIICLRWPYKSLLVLAVVSGVIIGLCRGGSVSVANAAYQPLYGRSVQVTGMIAQDPSTGTRGEPRFYIKNISINGQSYGGKIWANATKSDVKRGDIVVFTGVLKAGFGTVAATISPAQIISVQRPNPGDVARRIRDWFGGGVRKGIPDPQVSLGLGYLLGQKTALPPDLEADVKATGLTHVVVASGYNLTILVIFCRRLFLKVSKYLATLMSGLMIISFMLITGLSPSMTRAGLVAGLGLLVWYYGRKMHPFVLLSFAAAATILFEPSYIWGDLGWYLSFLSFIGVIVLAPLLHHYFWGLHCEPSTIRGLFIETLSATIVTTPIILMSFGIFATYALIANMLVLPFVPAAMLCTFIAGICGIVAPGMATIVALPATWLLKYSTFVIGHIADLPNSQIELTFNPPVMLVSYILLVVAITFLIRRTKHDFRDPSSKETV